MSGSIYERKKEEKKKADLGEAFDYQKGTPFW